MKTVYLARVHGWGGTSYLVGIFSTKELALENSIKRIAEESISEDEKMTPYNEEISPKGISSWDITNSDDVLSIAPIVMDELLKNF